MARNRKRPGSTPGSLVFVGDRKVEKIRIRLFQWDSETHHESELASIDEIDTGREDGGTRWINVDGLHDTELIRKAGERFGIHPLVLEDILNTTQRPKLEDYGTYLYAVMKLLSFDKESAQVRQEQISIVLAPNVVFSFQERVGDVFDVLRERIRNRESRIRRQAADYFFYRLIDTIVDNYFRALEQFGENLEEIEEQLMERPSRDLLREIQLQRREMLKLRKSVWPLREIIGGLQREETTLIADSTRVYLRDVYDHTIQVIDTLETQRDIVSGMQDMYLSSASNRMNEVMKTLTIMASIFIPLTFIAGIYGMNFNPDVSSLNMPELNWIFGYPFALALMCVIAGFMVFYFKKKGWL